MKLDGYGPSMILAASGLEGVAIWRFLFYCEMSSTDGRLEKLREFLPDKNNNSPPDCFRQKKNGLMSPIVQLSYAEANKQLPLPTRMNPRIKQVFKRHSTHRLVQSEQAPSHYMPNMTQ
jgi:hypothetical protein